MPEFDFDAAMRKARKVQTKIDAVITAEQHKRLRDQFAMAALSGLVSHPNMNPWNREGTKEDYARRAYAIADLMLKVRDE